MKYSLIILLIVVSHFCYSQKDYTATLSTRIEEIRKLPYFNNSIVVFTDSSDWKFGFPQWEVELSYYQNDIVFYKSKTYEAQTDELKGKKPNDHPSDWKQIGTNYHPYKFLRDTANIEDLKKC